MSNTPCEKCTYALWDEDKSVGIWPYVEECKHKFGARVFDEDKSENEDARCSFFIEQHELECEKVRCCVCGSSKTICSCFHTDNDLVKVECTECGHIVDVPIIAIPFY